MTTATLGLAINSGPAKQATVDLDALVPAAQRAEAATTKLGTGASAAFKQTGNSATEMAQRIKTAVDGAAMSAARINSALGVRDTFSSGSWLQHGQMLDELRAKYNPLFAAQRQYKQELIDIKAALAQGAINQAEYANAVMNTKVAFTQQVNALRPGRDALLAHEDSTKRLGAGFKGLSFEARNLGFQLVDVTQGAIMGQSAFMIMAQQGGQLAQIAAFSPNGLGGLFRELGKTFAGLLTPMRLLGVGAVAAGVAAYAMNTAWKSSALEFDNAAKAANATVIQIRALEAAASFKGIQTDDFLKATEKFSANIYQARNGMGSLGDVLRANGERATTFQGTLEAAANIIRRATSDQQRLQLLQQMGLPATMEWVRLLSGGAEGLRKATQEAGTFSAREQELIDKARQFDEAWNQGWAAFGRYAHNALLEAKAGLSDLGTWWQDFLGRNIGGNLGKAIRGETGGSAPGQSTRIDIPVPIGKGDAIDPNAVRNALSLEQQRISLLGQTASIGQQVRLIEIQIAQARLSGVRVTEQEVDKLKELARQRALGIDQIRTQADSYTVEADTVGMSTGKAVTYAAVQERINRARREGQTLTEANIAEIQREAEALGRAAQRVEDTRFAYDTFSGTMREFGANMRNGQKVWEAFGNAGRNALGKIADKLMDMGTQQLWQAAFPKGSGGGFLSLLSSLFGGGTAGDPTGVMHTGYGPGDPIKGRYVHPAYFENAPRYHGGIGPGERAAVLREDESVLTPGQMRALAPVNSARGGDIQVVLNVPPGTTMDQKPQRSQTANGGTRLDITLKRQMDDTNAGLIDSGESATNKSIERRYGLTPVL